MSTALIAPPADTAEPVIQATPIRLTEMQVGILARGMNNREFQLMGGEAGKSSGYLVARFLIKPVRKGIYTLTEQGRAAYEEILQGHAKALDITAHLIDRASGLNLNDTALQETEAARWERIANERMKTLRYAESTIDELGKLIEDRDAEIHHLEKVIEQRDLKIEALRREIDRVASKGKAS